MKCEPTDMFDLYTSDRGSIQGSDMLANNSWGMTTYTGEEQLKLEFYFHSKSKNKVAGRVMLFPLVNQ